MAAKIMVIGSLNMDLVVRVHQLPAPGETVLCPEYRTIPGGKGANQAVALARLGAQVSMVGCVGQDGFGDVLLENLRREGIDVTHLRCLQDAGTGIALISVDDQGQNSIVVASGANMRLAPQMARAALESQAGLDAVVLQLESPLEVVQEAARVAHQQGVLVVLNPAPARQLPEALLHNVDVLAPNEGETSLLSGLPVETNQQVEKAARRLLELGVGKVVLTLGSRGALALDKAGQITYLPAHQVQVVDTTAAGDAFVAGLALGLAEGRPLVEAARLGNAAGAIAVTRLGAQPAMPYRQEVEALLTSAKV